MRRHIPASALAVISKIYKHSSYSFLMTKVDVHGNEQRYKNWKEHILQYGEERLTKENSDLLFTYLLDMEIGANISKMAKKGARSYVRLNTIRVRLAKIMKTFQEKGVQNIAKVKEAQIMNLFHDMRNGTIKTARGEIYKSVGDYVKDFKAFWHWWIKVNRKKGIMVEDISDDLDTKKEKSKFVSVTKEELEKMLPYFAQDEQLILMFVFDSLTRAPTELMSLEVKDAFKRDGEVWVNVRQEISKVIGRTLNLLYCGDTLLNFIQRNNLKNSDKLFQFNYVQFTNKMQTVAEKVFGTQISEGGELYKNITLYDLRHSGAIHLRILSHKTKRISLDALRQRGGWTDFEMVNEYTRFLGLTGEIDKNDLMIAEDRSRLEKEIDVLKKENIIQQEKLNDLSEENKQILRLLQKLNNTQNLLLQPAVKNERLKKGLGDYLESLPIEEFAI